MTIKEIIIENDSSTFWHLESSDGTVWYEVKCGIHKSKRFETYEAALTHWELWDPEAEHDRLAFDI